MRPAASVETAPRAATLSEKPTAPPVAQPAGPESATPPPVQREVKAVPDAEKTAAAGPSPIQTNSPADTGRPWTKTRRRQRSRKCRWFQFTRYALRPGRPSMPDLPGTVRRLPPVDPNMSARTCPRHRISHWLDSHVSEHGHRMNNFPLRLGERQEMRNFPSPVGRGTEGEDGANRWAARPRQEGRHSCPPMTGRNACPPNRPPAAAPPRGRSAGRLGPTGIRGGKILRRDTPQSRITSWPPCRKTRSPACSQCWPGKTSTSMASNSSSPIQRLVDRHKPFADDDPPVGQRVAPAHKGHQLPAEHGHAQRDRRQGQQFSQREELAPADAHIGQPADQPAGTRAPMVGQTTLQVTSARSDGITPAMGWCIERVVFRGQRSEIRGKPSQAYCPPSSKSLAGKCPLFKR